MTEGAEEGQATGSIFGSSMSAAHDRPVRVLQVGSGNLFGGIEVCQRTLAMHRHACPEMEQEFAYCFAGKPAEELRRTGVAVHLLGAVRYSRPWTLVAARKAFRALLARGQYDVVVCHEVWAYGVVAPEVRRAGLPLVLWVHDRHGSGGAYEYLTRRTPPDSIIANSEWSAASLSTFLRGVPAAVIYCPVEGDSPDGRAQRRENRDRFAVSRTRRRRLGVLASGGSATAGGGAVHERGPGESPRAPDRRQGEVPGMATGSRGDPGSG
jgi:hypothetical protein